MNDLTQLLATFDALGVTYSIEECAPDRYERNIPKTTWTRVHVGMERFLFDRAGRYLGCNEYGSDECEYFVARKAQS